MKFYVIGIAIMLYSVILPGCQKPVTLSVDEQRKVSAEMNDKILIDASRDGGVWWFPQSSETGFSSDSAHQGKQLADSLRSMGYEVDEWPRGTPVTDSLLNQYDKVIRAGGFGAYTASEIEAYDHFINKGSSLILLLDHLSNYRNDDLSEHLGIQFAGGLFGDVTVFATHPVTAGVTSLYYAAGSVVINANNNSSMTILGSLDSSVYFDQNSNGQFDNGDILGPPVMGILNSYPHCRIFFMGEMNGLETVPQPFVNNLVQWAFK
jgi:hypothetical protein